MVVRWRLTKLPDKRGEPARRLNISNLLILLLWITCQIAQKDGVEAKISPLLNQTFLGSTGAHGIKLTRYGTAMVFDGYWSQLIEIQFSPIFEMNKTIFKETKCLHFTHKDLCLHFNKMKESVYNASEDFKEIYMEKLSHMMANEPRNTWVRSRKKRMASSVIPLVGDALEVLFGTATKNDLDTLSGKVSQLVNIVGENTDVTATMKADLIGLTKMLDTRTEKVNKALESVATHINQVSDKVYEMYERVDYIKQFWEDRVSLQTEYNDMIVNSITAMFNFTLLADAVNDIDRYFAQLRKGILPVSLIPYAKLKPILQKITKALGESYELGIREENWDLYYLFPLVKFSLVNSGILLKLTIPLKAKKRENEFKILIPNASPIPCSGPLCTWHDRLNATNSYVTMNIRDRAWLTDLEYERLKYEIDLSTFKCLTIGRDSVCYVLDKSLVMKPSRCTSAIWSWDRKDVMSFCQFELSLKESYQPIRISDGTWIIHKEIIQKYAVICGDSESKDHEITHWAETVTIKNGCRLESDSHLLYGPLKYHNSKLDMIQTKPPQFIFSADYISNDVTMSERKYDYERQESESRMNKSRLDVGKLAESLQLDARFSTAVNDKLYRSVNGIQLRMMRLETIQYRAQNRITLISILQGIGKLFSVYCGFVFMTSMIRNGNQFLGMRAVIIIIPSYGSVEGYVISGNEAEPEGLYETLIGNPFGPALTIVLIFLAIGVLSAMKFKSMFRTMNVTHFRGKVISRTGSENNKKCYFYISFVYRTGSLLRAYLNEITLKVPTTFLDVATKDSRNVLMRGSLKYWHIDWQNGIPCFVIPFPMYVRIELENGEATKTNEKIIIPLDAIDWGNSAAPVGLDDYGLRGEAVVTFMRESK